MTDFADVFLLNYITL